MAVDTSASSGVDSITDDSFFFFGWLFFAVLNQHAGEQ